MKNLYCSVCASKMKIIPRKGEICYIDFEGKKHFYEERFNRKTGKPLLLYSCPNWGLVESGYLFKRSRMNNHDRYPENEI